MAFLNSASLLNMGAAEAAKKASGNTPVQEIQTNQSDEFAQALRKQLHQAKKSANTIVPPADAKNNQPLKETMHAQSAQAAGNNVKNEPAAKEQPKTTAATAKEKSADSEGDQNKTIEDQAATTEAASGVNETAQDRKKRLMTNLQATDPAATASITPWMQSMTAMIAMRNSSAENVATGQADIAIDAAASALTRGEFTIDPAATELAKQALADQPSGSHIPAEINPNAPQTAVAVDSKIASAADSLTPVTEKPANFSETLDIAKSVADAVRETIATDKTVDSAGNIDILSETSNTVTLPAAQALPNSAWLNAAGVSQTTNVLTSQLSAPFGNERWQTAMNQHVLNMVGSGDDVASLTLSPPDLGPIQVVLKVDNQSVNTSFITDNPLVRQALEDGLQDLRDRMQSQGLELGHTFVGNGQQAEQHFEQQSAKGNGRAAASSAEAEAAALTQTAVRTTVSRGLVDTFA